MKKRTILKRLLIGLVILTGVAIIGGLPWIKDCSLVKKHEEIHVEIKESNEPKESAPRLTAFGEFFSKIVIPVGSGIGAIIVLAVIAGQLANQRKELIAQNRIAIKEVAAKQFNNAIKFLGDSHQTVVLGGVYALNNLARTNPKEYSQTVFEVLCGFIREETSKEEYKVTIMAQMAGTQVPPGTKPSTSLNVIQTIIKRLFRRVEPQGLYGNYLASLSGAFLRGVKFEKNDDVDLEINWQGADLQEADLQDAILRKANLRKAILISANLQGVRFEYANLQGANLWKVNLRGANLQGANLQGANLQGTDLHRAELRSANFGNAKLQGANLRNVKILHNSSPDWFSGTDMRGIRSKKHPSEVEAAYKSAIKKGVHLETDLSGIILLDAEGNTLVLSDDDKKRWFQKRGAVVDFLPVNEVKQLVK